MFIENDLNGDNLLDRYEFLKVGYYQEVSCSEVIARGSALIVHALWFSIDSFGHSDEDYHNTFSGTCAV